MNHHTTQAFWKHYAVLPDEIQRLADKNFALLKTDPRHPSLHLKRVGRFWSARVALSHRALALQREEVLIWFWIGDHAGYDRLLNAR